MMQIWLGLYSHYTHICLASCVPLQELLQQKLFASKRYLSDLVSHLYTNSCIEFYPVDTINDSNACAQNLMNMLMSHWHNKARTKSLNSGAEIKKIICVLK